jgi:hypothetical protein
MLDDGETAMLFQTVYNKYLNLRFQLVQNAFVTSARERCECRRKRNELDGCDI